MRMKPSAARREDLGLAKGDYAILRRLDTPKRIQVFVNAIPANHEMRGETLLSVSGVLGGRRAHCMEAAMLAACALWIHGEPPLLMHLGCESSDYPHVVALFRRGLRWGAISKSNGIALRYRDPVYTCLRELAMSYFHEYADKAGRRTLRSYSVPFDLRRLDATLWVTAMGNCWEAHDRLERTRHYELVSPAAARNLSKRDLFERENPGR
jgi:hypothetical protein